MSERLKALADAGVSIWLDDLSRERIETGNLAELVKDSSVVGVTTNPTIFASALADGERYDDQVRELAAAGKDVDEAIFSITTTDVRNACDVLADTFAATGGVDGRVSIEVSPTLAHDDEATIASAKQLWAEVDRPNLFIKIPATTEGGPAITDALARGHQRQRHADLRARPLRQGDGRLPRGPRAGQGERQGPLEDPLRRVVLRLPRRHRDRQAPRGVRQPAGPEPARARRHRQRAAGLRGLREEVRRRAVRCAQGRRAPTRSARCGPRPASRTRSTATRCTSPTSRSPTPSTRCRRRRCRPSPTTARSRATRSPPSTTRPGR